MYYCCILQIRTEEKRESGTASTCDTLYLLEINNILNIPGQGRVISTFRRTENTFRHPQTIVANES